MKDDVSFSPAQQIERLVAQIKPPSGTRLVLGYSGGADSEVLAYGLASFAREHPEFDYLLVHIHHGLSDNADRWQRHCQQNASSYQLAIEVDTVTIKQDSGSSLEAVARTVRYQALQSHMKVGDILLTAHHQDDQLETLLLALKRGQGPKGLGGIRPIQKFVTDKWLLRPLLDIQRHQIEAFAHAQGLTYVEDESNADSRFDRNYLRMAIIPQLKARWPAISSTAARSARLCAEQQALIDEEMHRRLPPMLLTSEYSVNPVLDLTALVRQSELWQAQLLRGFFTHLDVMPPSAAQLDQILEQVVMAKADASVEIRLPQVRLRRFRQHLYTDVYRSVETNSQIPTPITLDQSALDKEQKHGVEYRIDAQRRLSVVTVNSGVRLRLPANGEILTVRFGASGSLRCHPHTRQHSRPLKKLFQEFGVPPWERPRVPLVYLNDCLVGAVGLWTETLYMAKDKDLGLGFSIISSC